MARKTGPGDGDEGRESTALTGQRWRTPAYDRGTSPFSFMRRMAADMDRLLGRDLWSGGPDLEQLAWMPQVETFRRDNQLVVRADLPGMKREDVEVEIENGMLKISGERREEHEEKRDQYYRTERSYGRFHRAIPLPEGTSEEQCEATFKDGVLEVTMPAPKEVTHRGKKIEIR